MNNGPHSPTFLLECAHISDLGMRRMNNQDAIAVLETHDAATWVARGHLFMVADGMGAHAAGELASKLAVDNITHMYFKLRDLYPPAALRQAIREANRVIHAKGQSSIGFHGMGTTCSCLVLLPQGALVAHVGDSRVYRLRGSLLEQLTFDHSLVWEMAAAGEIPEAEVPAYIPKNIITRSLGPHPAINIDIEGPYQAMQGDIFLVCSDGLSGQLADEELGAILECLPPSTAAQSLVDLANLRGGPDNISVVIARILGGEPNQAAFAESDQFELPACRGARRGPSPPLWIAFAACLAGLAYCVVYEYWLGATIAATLSALLVGLWSYRAGAAAGTSGGSIGGPYGNGPYRKVDCGPTRAVVDAIAEVARKLRDLEEKNRGNWSVDWRSFDATVADAGAAAEAGRFADAIRHYCQAIREVMQQLRNHRTTLDDSSGLHPTPAPS
jgi:protein phosphatase